MTTYLLVDTANTFFRARYAAHKHSDTWTKLGFSMHITMGCVNKAWRIANADHVVFALEGRSWRKDFFEPYKKNRAVKREALNDEQIEEDKLFWETYDELTTFLKDNANCSVLQCEIAEADDIIARFIHMHPDDNHVIVSSDTDFVQLVSKNVNQYNGIQGHTMTLEGVFDDYGKPVKDKKTGELKTIDPEWLLFEKCIRGDSSDNVFSAYPGARKKGTKNKIGLEEAFADKDAKGFNWNNFMLQRWVDHENVEHRVLDDYNRNMHLIDLTAQPEDIKTALDATIVEQVQRDKVTQVGVHFMKFCGKHSLDNISKNPGDHAVYLNAGYQNV